MSYDFVGMFNNVLGLLFGIVVSTLSLAVIVPADRSWRPQRAKQLLLSSLAMARNEPLAGLQSRFESRVRDLTVQLIALRPAGTSPDADESLGLVILGLASGSARLDRTRCAARSLP
jgi:hypothetical protein